ncbi:MAG TPA: proton-conducting transporter membrane subunit [Gammaproteobacteria bacterium]|nr:proton-conducting transporter membrane subunit [Gammaproteobacteria bacterium]
MERALVYVMLGAPMAAIVLALLSRRARVAEAVNLLASVVVLVCVFPLLILTPVVGTVFGDGFLLVTPFGVWVLLCVALVYFLASFYAVGYMRLLDEEPRLPQFYALFAGFAFTMLAAPLMNRPGLYWIAIELTTLVSAFLVGFEREAESIEAAWKYVIIVSAGISLGLLGTMLFYWGGSFVLGPVYDMTWATLRGVSGQINVTLLGLAFLLVLVGYGTKVGLAPMHTWLPDAHSEGPAPVSAMLSGALLNTAMLGVARFLSVLDGTRASSMSRRALVFLGVTSLLIAALFIVRQKGVKRLMAYSSIEHMGVVALGFGFGGPLGVAGAAFHMLNHSLNKSLMFFGSGNMMRAYGSKDMDGIFEVGRHYPVSGNLWLAGAVAITGAPPFALFLSEFTVLRAGMAGPNAWAVWVMAVLLIVIFVGFLNHFRRMYYRPAVNANCVPHLELSLWNTVPMWLALLPLLVFGLWWPADLWRFFLAIGRELGSGG